MIDLSHPLDHQTPVYPNDPPPRITILDSAERPAARGERRLNCSQISMGLHCGTHMDAPFHFFSAGQTIDQAPLEWCCGPALLVNLPEAVDYAQIEPVHLADHEAKIRGAKRVVLNTLWHRRWGEANYFSEHPVLSGAAARFLVDCGVVLVGVDFPSVDHPPFPAHLVLLGNGVLIVENLTNLQAVKTDIFQLAALPLRICGRDGSPVRAIAIE
jgi:kynurenine formamidase